MPIPPDQSDHIARVQFTTPRLAITHWTGPRQRAKSDEILCAELAAILTPKVLQDLPPSMQLTNSANAVQDWVRDVSSESELHLVSTVDADQLIGALILVSFEHPPAPATLHLGYLFSQPAWGQGYATELVAGLLGAVRPLAPLRLVGGVAISNPASARVLQKLGFAQDRDQTSTDTAFYIKDFV